MIHVRPVNMTDNNYDDEFGDDEFNDDEFGDDEFDENGSGEDDFTDEDGFTDEDEMTDADEEGDDGDFDFDEENGIEIPCPECSPKEDVQHEILKPGRNPVARCMDCGHVHSYTVEKPRLKEVKVIVSKMENTVVLRCLFDETERFDVDDEIVADDENSGEAYPVMITSIECGSRRPAFSKVKDIDTIWARAIDEVTVRIAIKKGEITSSVLQKVPGDFVYVVGADLKIDKKILPILAIKVRGGGFRRKEGDAVPAKKVKRIFTKDHASTYGKYGRRNGGRHFSGYDGSRGTSHHGFDSRRVYRYDNGEEMSDRDRRYREWYDRQNSRGGEGNYRRNINDRDAGYSPRGNSGRRYDDGFSAGDFRDDGDGYGSGGRSGGHSSGGGRNGGHGSGSGKSGGYSSGSGSGRSGGYSSGSGRNGGYSSGGRHGSNAPKKPAYRKNARPPVNRGRK